ncbi:MAG: guanitoxin biosynthesis pre-guanitoxin forming N-methyltransferase GntF [Kineosporiaceae bacterium]
MSGDLAAEARWAGYRTSWGPWVVSAVATAASTYALDAAAAATGLLVAASGLLDGLGRDAALALLVASYGAWGLGVRANLGANWAVLEATGTSTNVLSKAGRALVRRRSGSVRAARTAAAVGYAGTELVKEVPYYATAFGAATLTDSVTVQDAVVFVVGANLGAALYEYGLARLTRALLAVRAARRRQRRPASFDTDWVPAEYLADYYGEVEPDEVATIAYIVDALREAAPGRPVLFFGVGPTMHHVFAAAEAASEIHLGDYLPANLAEIRSWLERRPGAHDWRPFVRYTLQCEGVALPTPAQVSAREELTRQRVTRLLLVDAWHARPVAAQYSTVVSAYCADSATDDRDTWALFMRNITGLVEPGGLFVAAALRRCRGYAVGGKTFPCADVDDDDLHAVLRPDFAPSVEVRRVGQDSTHGYAAIVLVRARRATARRPAPVVGARVP